MSVEEGSLAPVFSCISTSISVSLMWQRLGDRTLPSGVVQDALRSESQNLALLWSRLPRFSDAYTYTCNASNANGMNSVRLELTILCEQVHVA